MRSDLQIQASRANGSKSRGPLTGEGKRASSRNALKHGILSECILLPGESPESFQSLTAGLFKELHPVGSTEEDLVEMMAVARWRRMRVWTVEKNCLTNGMVSTYLDAPEPRPSAEVAASLAFAALANQSRTLDLINRYESRYDRQYFRAHRRLLESQDRRMPNEPGNTPPPAPVSRPTPDAAEITESAKGTQADTENTEPTAPTARLPHWLPAFTLAPPAPESPESAAIPRVAAAVDQS